MRLLTGEGLPMRVTWRTYPAAEPTSQADCEEEPTSGGISMPTYTFELKDGSCGIADETGVRLPDREHALRYAHDVVHELMGGREPQTRFWRLDVYEDSGERIFEIPFVRIDRTLDHLVPELRTIMEGVCDRQRALKEAIYAARVTVRESRALIGLARHKLYLATYAGERTIRDREKSRAR